MELAKLKELLGIKPEDTSKDTVLQFAIDDVTEIILNYCNLQELPADLTNTAYRMTMDLYRNENPGGEKASEGVVSSLTEGDTSVSFKTSTDTVFAASILKNYTKTLNRYRKVVW